MKYPKAITLVVLLLILSSCKKKCEEYYLGSLIYMNPYNGNEVLKYHNSTGDDIIFIGQGRSTRMNTLQASYSGDVCTSTEFDNCYFEEENNKYKLTISLRPTTDYQSAYLGLNLLDYTFNDYWHYNSRSLFNLPLKMESLKPGQSYFDSLLVLNKYFYNVFADEPELDTSPNKSNNDTVHPSIFYYNTTHGLIKVDFDDGTSWELKEIIP